MEQGTVKRYQKKPLIVEAIQYKCDADVGADQSAIEPVMRFMASSTIVKTVFCDSKNLIEPLLYVHEKDSCAVVLVDHEKGNSLIRKHGSLEPVIKALIIKLAEEYFDGFDGDQWQAANLVEELVLNELHDWSMSHA